MNSREKSLLRKIWRAMHSRCKNSKDPDYKNYGGRGITVCEDWADVETFLTNLGPRPLGYRLERINNNGDYSPLNCTWATPTTQTHNQRLRCDNTSGLKGVTWDSSRKGRWFARGVTEGVTPFYIKAPTFLKHAVLVNHGRTGLESPELPPERELPDWLTKFVQNTQWGEAPQRFYFWVGMGTIAAALRRRVWLPMGSFQWFPNLYILLVAPPGVIQKSSTADLGLVQLFKNVPGINFGPSTVIWQALYDAFAEVWEEIQVSPEEVIIQHALVINSSEFGITLNPKDTEMVDQLVHIWDNREMAKRTRKDGLLVIPTPCLNMIACTTPAWIAENMPRYLIGGGLTSRMVFVYGETKERFIALM